MPTVDKGETAEDAARIEESLEAGHYPEKVEWSLPELGQTCCVVSSRNAG